MKIRATMTAAAATLVCALTASLPGYAATHARPVNPTGAANKMPYQNRVQNQQQRAQRAYQSGKITQSEYNHDTKKLNAVQSQERTELQNGNLTSQQRAHLKNKLDKSADRINDQRHYSNPPQ